MENLNNTTGLLSFEVENFKSFKENVKIDFNIKKNTKFSKKEIGNIKLNCISGFYGRNASGKSNLFELFDALKRLLKHNNINSLNFYYYTKKPIKIGIKFVKKQTIYEYNISFLSGQIYEQSLTKKGIFDSQKTKYKQVFYCKDGTLLINDKEVQKNLQSNFNVLFNWDFFRNIVLNFPTEDFENIREFILDDIWFLSEKSNNLKTITSWLGKQCYENEQLLRVVNKICPILDLGISSLKITKVVVPTASGNISVFNDGKDFLQSKIKKSFQTVYAFEFYNINKKTDKEFQIPIQDLSSGTDKYLYTILLVLTGLYSGKVLIFDELGLYLDENLLASLLNIYNINYNKHSSQLIFNSSNSYSLKLLDWDAIYIVDINEKRESFVRRIESSEYKGSIINKYTSGQLGSESNLDLIEHTRIIEDIFNE